MSEQTKLCRQSNCLYVCAIQLGIELNLQYIFMPSLSLVRSCSIAFSIYLSIFVDGLVRKTAMCQVKNISTAITLTSSFRETCQLCCCWSIRIHIYVAYSEFFCCYCMQCICVQMRWHNIENKPVENILTTF